MIRWAIMHKSGKFMPQSSSKRHGYTHDEPVWMDRNGHCPRLFSRAQDAATALTWWLKGETSARASGGPYITAFGDESDDYGVDWRTDERADRKAKDMKVVTIYLEVRGGFH